MREVFDCSEGWLFSTGEGAPERRVSLPHSAFPEPEEIRDPRMGKVFYRYEFEAPEAWREKICFFEIGGAMQKAEISLNGVPAFTHSGGYQKFFVPLSGSLKYGGKNTLGIALDNRPSADMPPGKETNALDFCYFSGLHRSARIIVFEPVHISDELAVSIPAGGGVFIRTEAVFPDTAFLHITCHVMNEIPPGRRFAIPELAKKPHEVYAELKIYAPCGGCVFSASSDTVRIAPNCDHTFTFGADAAFPKLWSPDSPALYRAEFRIFHNGVAADARTETFGIRTLEFRRDGFFLNGVKTELFGTNRHSAFPFVGNAAGANAQIRDAILIRKAGFNFVRLSHYNQPEEFIRACDRLGIMVLPAIPGWQAYHANSNFIQNAFRDCRELVRSLRNHPSVILWEVSLNEAYPPSWINAGFHKIAHEEYPGPFCFTAGDTFGGFEGWDVLFPCTGMRSADKPLLLREYGDWAFGGQESSSRQPRGASIGNALIQTWNFLWSLNRLRSVPGMTGSAEWCFLDYNRGCGGKYGMERSGSLDLYRLPKIKYEFYRSQNDGEPAIYAVHDGSSKLIVFSNCDEVELARTSFPPVRQKPDAGPDSPYGKNGSPGWETALPDNLDTSGGNPFDGGNASHLKHPPFTFFQIPPPQDNDAWKITGFLQGRPAAEFILRKPGPAVRVKSRIRTEGIEPVPGDLLFADALLLDRNGWLVPESRTVTPVLSGAAEIIGGMKKTEAGIASFLIRVTGKNFSIRFTSGGLTED